MSWFPNLKKMVFTLGTDLPVVVKASGTLRDLVNPVVKAAQSDRGVYWTVPAKPGLLENKIFVMIILNH